MASVLTTAELAEKIGTDPRTLRKFLRATTPKDSQPGKGSRYAIEGKSVRLLAKGFDAWKSAQDAKKAEADMTPEAPETEETAE